MRNFLRTTLLACVLSLCLVVPGLAGPYEDGLAAYNRGDYAKALRLFRSLAEQGDADAQYRVGAIYRYGFGVPQDYTKAIAWFRKAAEQGYAKAQYNLGLTYVKGKGVPQDYVEAHKWFNIAASRFPASEAELLNKAVKARDATAKKMTSAKITEALRLAREWKPKK